MLRKYRNHLLQANKIGIKLKKQKRIRKDSTTFIVKVCARSIYIFNGMYVVQ